MGDTLAAGTGGFPGRGGLSPWRAHAAGRTPVGVLEVGLETTSGRASWDSVDRCCGCTSLSSVTIVVILVDGVEALGTIAEGVVPKSNPEEDLSGGAGAWWGEDCSPASEASRLGGRLLTPPLTSELVRLVVDRTRLRALEEGRRTPSGNGLDEPDVPNATSPPFLKVELASWALPHSTPPLASQLTV